LIMLMYCNRSGVIGIASVLPKGHLIIARGDEATLKEQMMGKARLAWDNETYLVPGIPEALNSAAALAALWRFIEFIGMLNAISDDTLPAASRASHCS
jgi:hypothetical protein